VCHCKGDAGFKLVIKSNVFIVNLFFKGLDVSISKYSWDKEKGKAMNLDGAVNNA